MVKKERKQFIPDAVLMNNPHFEMGYYEGLASIESKAYNACSCMEKIHQKGWTINMSKAAAFVAGWKYSLN